MASLPRSSKRTLEAFQIKFSKAAPGSSTRFPTLGHDASIYDVIDDLVVLQAPQHDDPLTKFLQDHMAFWL
jgi:hypothetical protein